MTENRNMLWCAVLMALVFSAANPRAGNASKKDGVMIGLIYKLLENATAVIFAKPVSVNSGGSDFACTHVFKGPVHITDTVPCTFPPSGKDTPVLVQGREYLLFLHLDQSKSGFTLVNFSTAIDIPSEKRAQIAEILHEYTDLAAIPSASADSAMQLLVFRMLNSGIPMFERDGTRLAEQVHHWKPDAMKELHTFVSGTETRHGLTGQALGVIINVIIAKSELDSLDAFILTQVERENTDYVYYGLLCRPEKDVDTLMMRLLQNNLQNIDLVESLLRITGLLRRDDLLDWFEKNAGVSSDAAAALKNARKLVDR